MRTTAYGAALLAAALVLLAWNLGGPGLWDPEELAAVAGARPISGVTAAAIRAGIAVAGGPSEIAARAPVALLAALALTAVIAAGAIARGRRGALASGLVLATSPLFVLQARVAASEMGSIAAGALIALGVALVAGRARPLARVAGGAVVLFGVAAIAWAELSRLPSPAPPSTDWVIAAERIAYGAFPWTAALPLVAGRPPRWAWAVVAAGAVAAATWAPRAFDPALPALAVAIGAALGDRRPRQPAAAVSALALAFLLGRDLARFPAQLAACAVAVPSISVDTVARAVPAITGALFGGASLVWLWQPRRRVVAALAAATSVLFAVLLAHQFLPAVSRQRSVKQLYERWRAIDPGGPPPALWRTSERAAALYAPGARRADGRDQVAGWLADPSSPHRYAIVAGPELCVVRAATIARGGRLRVFAGDPASAALVGGAASDPARERNPLAGRLEHRPGDIRPALADFDGSLELLAVDLPARVARGDRFEIALTFRVRRTPTRPWQLFVHVERGGAWIKGDHPPIARLCPPTTWQRGDVVIDRHRMKAGDISHPRGRYQVFVGLFVGGGGSWTNMPVRSGDNDGHDRIRAGSILID